MYKTNIITLLFVVLGFFLACCNSSFSQGWRPLEGDLHREVRCLFGDDITNKLYVGGASKYAGNVMINGIATWDGVQWDSLASGETNCSSVCSPFLAVTGFNNEIYTGGYFNNVGGVNVNYIAKWDGSQWHDVAGGTNGIVCCIRIINNELYIGGRFDSAGGVKVNGISKWDGNEWISIGFPELNIGYVYAIEYYKNDLYIGGNFYSSAYPNDTLQNIIRYDGSTWRSVAGGMHGPSDEIATMIVYNDELYVAGSFIKEHGNSGDYIQKWNGSSWIEVGGGVDGKINQLLVFDGKLFAVGAFEEAGGVTAARIATWDGANWCGLGGNFDNTINCLGVFQDTLYIGGGFIYGNGETLNYIAKWIGGNNVDTCGHTSWSDQGSISKKPIVLYPNPFHYESKLVLSDEIKGGTLAIYNLLGQEIQSIKNIQGKEIFVSRNSLSNGMYFFRLTEGVLLIGQGKLLVE